VDAGGWEIGKLSQEEVWMYRARLSDMIDNLQQLVADPRQTKVTLDVLIIVIEAAINVQKNSFR